VVERGPTIRRHGIGERADVRPRRRFGRREREAILCLIRARTAFAALNDRNLAAALTTLGQAYLGLKQPAEAVDAIGNRTMVAEADALPGRLRR
jgi:hypothetical protein